MSDQEPSLARAEAAQVDLPSQADAVIIGGGMMGVSLLYHLALEGWTNLVLIEKDELTSGSTWHAAGQVPSLTGNYNIAKMHHYANALFPRLEKMTGQYVGWHDCGGIRLAVSQDEVDWFSYIAGYAKSVGFHFEIIPPEEIRKKHPFITLDGVIAGAWTNQDGHVDPSGGCNALAAAARALGAKIVRKTLTTGISRKPGGAWLVETTRGNLLAGRVVNAGGCYARQIGQMVGLDVPIVNMEHQYFVTDTVPELQKIERELPVIRDPLVSGYYRQEQKSYLIGIYEHCGAAEAWKGNDGQPLWTSTSELFSADVDRVAPWLSNAMERMPVLANLGIKRVVNGAITHTPDGLPLLGPAEGLPGFWMCCGSPTGIGQGPGCGKYLAQWMVHGDSEINMRDFDPRRFGRYADQSFTRAKVTDDFQRSFTLHLPGEERSAGRPKRKSPLYEPFTRKGCVHTESFGWERPKLFSGSGKEICGFRRTDSFSLVGSECKAVREKVGIIDLSSFSKFEVRGPDATAFLNRLFMNRLPRKVGGVSLGHPLSSMGRILSELTVTRLAEGHFYLASAAASQVRDFELLSSETNSGENVSIADVTDEWGVLVVSGPNARNLLARVTNSRLGNDAFPWLTSQVIDIAGTLVRALRVNYVGELGWELHAPMARIAFLYDAIWEAGQDLGIADYGLYALNSLRMEKGYRSWGAELTNEITPLEAGLDRFIAFDKGEFVGRAALINRKHSDLAHKLFLLKVDAVDSDPRGNEPVFLDGEFLGVTTSGAYGYATGMSLSFAYLNLPLPTQTEYLTVELLGKNVKAEVLSAPPYDSSNERLRS